MHQYLSRLSLILLIGCPIGIALPATIAEAQSAQASPSPLSYKQTFDERTKLYDESCVVPEKRVYQGLKYELCRMEDLGTRVSIEGPEGDNGPTAYFYSGRLYAFRDTGLGEAWIFQKGKLMAEVEVGFVAPEAAVITTKFTATDRKQMTDRAISSTRKMLKVFGLELRL